MFDMSEYTDFNGNSCQIYILIDPPDNIVHYVGRTHIPGTTPVTGEKVRRA